jgi:type II secretory pathway component PulJ
MTPRRRYLESGFTIVELLVGIVVSSIAIAGLVGMFIGASRLFGTWESRRTARDVVQGAAQLLSADLRRVETTGGIEAASDSTITLRVPYAMGLVCASAAANTTVSLLPTDSVMYAEAAPSGYAWRTATGYSYGTSITSLTAGVAATCTGVNISTLTGGRVVLIAPGAGPTVTAGTPVFLYQRVQYEFQTTSDGRVLTRTQDIAPATLSTLRGFELALEGQGEYAAPGAPTSSTALAQKVFFRNPPN